MGHRPNTRCGPPIWVLVGVFGCAGNAANEQAGPPDAAVDAGAAQDDASPSGPPVTLDPAFGTGGGIGGALSSWTPIGVAVDPQHRIVVSGPGNDPSSPPANVIRRYSADGTLDETFGTAGAVSIPVDADLIAQTVAVLPDGRIGVLGSASNAGTAQTFAARLEPDGTLDTTFAGYPVLAGAPEPFSWGLWESDGSGFAFGSTGGTRFDSGGVVSVTYGTDGAVPAAQAGAVGSDGMLWTATGGEVSRFLTTGAPDPTFGEGGSAPLSWGTAVAPAIQTLLLGTNDQAVAVGSTVEDTSQYLDVAALAADGGADTAFAPGGFVPILSNGGPLGAGALADGSLLVWTSGGDVVSVSADGSMQYDVNLVVGGTVLGAALDGSNRLVAIGIVTADPMNSEWFVRRYALP